MAVSLATNIDTQTVLRNLEKTQRGVSTSIAKLSSGLRITHAGDDAAGLALSEQLKGVVRGLAQAQRNGLDGISMIQVAEGALNEMHSALSRMRELAVQSANAIQSTTSRGFIDAEFRSLRAEIDQIADSTNFNGTKLVNTAQEFKFQIGAYALASENQIAVSMLDMSVSSLGGSVANSTTLAGTSVSTMTAALGAISSIDQAISDVSAQRGKIGAAQNRLTFAIDNLSSARENLLAANSRISDVDVAQETSDFTRGQILAQAGVSILAQSNQLPAVALQLLR